jgi:hypothetical protein
MCLSRLTKTFGYGHFVRYVHFDEESTHLGSQARAPLHIDIEECDPNSGCSQRPRGGFTQTRSATGNHRRYRVIQFHSDLMCQYRNDQVAPPPESTITPQ